MNLSIINFSDGKYIRGQERLCESLLLNGIKEQQMMFWDNYPSHWPKESEVFKGFKPYAFKDAENAGFTAAIWVDANCICVKSIKKIEKNLEKDGVFVFSRYSETVGNWISDYSLSHLGIDRVHTHHMPELTTCVVGINFKHPAGRLLLEQWFLLAQKKEAYNGVPEKYTFSDTRNNDNKLLSPDSRVKGHRTDQSMVGVLAGALHIFPNNKYVFDLIGEASKGRPYAKYIPFSAIFVQNRDIKNQEEYLKDLSKYVNNKSIIYLLGRIYYSSLRSLKDFVKWILYYHKLYKFR